MEKKGQFFILAAVILAGIIISLSLTTNYAQVNQEPENFYDFSYKVAQESGMVLDHQIYSDFEDDANLTQFIDLLARDIRDKDPDSNMIFIYGTNERMNIRNYGSTSLNAENSEIMGGGAESTSNLKLNILGVSTSTQITNPNDLTSQEWTEEFNLGNKDSIDIELEGQIYNFPVSNHKQVIFIVQKSSNNENFISIR